jgi:adenylate cyclase
MTELKLLLQQGDNDTTVTVNQDVFTIGRLPECNLHLPFGGVSRCHARIVKISADLWTIEDLGSKNGTQLNERLVTSPQKLQHGDIVWLGDVSLLVLYGDYTEASFSPRQQEVAERRTIFVMSNNCKKNGYNPTARMGRQLIKIKPLPDSKTWWI